MTRSACHSVPSLHFTSTNSSAERVQLMLATTLFICISRDSNSSGTGACVETLIRAIFGENLINHIMIDGERRKKTLSAVMSTVML